MRNLIVKRIKICATKHKRLELYICNYIILKFKYTRFNIMCIKNCIMIEI